MQSELEAQLRRLMTFFLEENTKINLSALRSPEKCWIGNVLDSLAFLDISPPPRRPAGRGGVGEGPGVGVLNILDLGTGGGFPLLPLALLLPDAHCTGLDATQKKINAVRRIADALELKNVTLICGRAETLGHDRRYREQFDVVTARAVAEVNVLLEYASPFVKVGGKIILWKSMDVDRKLKESERAQKEFHCILTDRHVYELPTNFGKRQLLVFEKTGKTTHNYPRPIGVAKKKPI